VRLSDEQIKKLQENFEDNIKDFGENNVVVSSGLIKNFLDTIEALQQEIERLNKVLDDWKYNAKCDADHIAGLLADKDEQAGRIMQYDAVLKQARKALKTCEEIASSEKNQLFWTADVAHKAVKTIDALLGGGEDTGKHDHMTKMGEIAYGSTCNTTKLPCAECTPVCEHRRRNDED